MIKNIMSVITVAVQINYIDKTSNMVYFLGAMMWINDKTDDLIWSLSTILHIGMGKLKPRGNIDLWKQIKFVLQIRVFVT